TAIKLLDCSALQWIVDRQKSLKPALEAISKKSKSHEFRQRRGKPLQVLIRYFAVRKNHLATDRTGPRVLLEKPHHALKGVLVHARIGVEEKNAAGFDVRSGQ